MKHLKLFFALFAMLALGVGNAWGATYTKVTSAPADWSGEYIVVYESDNTAYVWTGVDAAKCNTTATISSNSVTGDFVTVTIAPMTGGYSIKVNGGTNSGKYIYGTSGSNKLNFGASTQQNTLSYETDWVKITSNTSVLTFNKTSSDMRFRYYKSSSYSSQQHIQLYKLSTGGGVTPDPITVTLDKSTLSLEEGENATLTATVTGSTNAVTWTSDASNIASVDNAGKVTAIAAGTANITAAIGDVKATCAVTVTAATTPDPGTGGEETTVTYILKEDPNHPANSIDWFNGTIDQYTGWTATKGTNNPKYYDAGEGLRVYNGGKFTITSTKVMTSITLTFSGTGYTFSAGNTTNPQTVTLNANSYEWSVSQTCRLQKIEITYAADAGGDEGGGEETAPSLTPDPASWDFGKITENTTATAKEFTISGLNLTSGDLTITAPEGYSVTPTTVAVSGATLESASIKVTPVTSKVGTFDGNLTITGCGLKSAVNVALKLTVEKAPATPTENVYVKVTSTEGITDGEYLIVYETDKVAFNGALDALDVASNTVEVTISDNVITGNTDIDKALFTIDATNGTILSASGKYIGGKSSNENGINISETALENALSIDQDDNAVIASNGKAIRYNKTAGQTRFRYFKDNGGTQEKIQLYKKVDPNAVVEPIFTPAAGEYYGTQSVTISCATAGAEVYYTLDGTDPKSTSSTKYTGAISIASTTTIKAVAIKGENSSAVVSATYTILTPLATMQEIFDKATAVGGTATPIHITMNNWVVTGVKNSNVYVTDGTKGLIIYTASHGFNVGDMLSGTVACKVQLYDGSSELTELTSTTEGLTVSTGGVVTPVVVNDVTTLGGVNTGSVIKITGPCTVDGTKYYVAGVQLYNSLYTYTNPENGYNYECTGVYLQYNTTKEILPRKAEDLVKIETQQPAGIKFETTEYTANVNEAFTAPTLTNPNRLTVTYSTSDATLATVNTNTGAVTIGNKTGKVTITASFAGNEDYVAATASYNITISDPNQLEATFVAGTDKSDTKSISKNGITVEFTNGVFNRADNYRCYGKESMTISYADGNITKIVIECTANDGAEYGPGQFTTETVTYSYSGKVGTWTGEANSVTFTADKQVRMTAITVYYKQDNRADAGLAWNPATVSLTVGDAFTAPTFNNPNNLAPISFNSDNTALATVNNAGVISLKASAVGTATITATFAGNDAYKDAEVKCTISVSPKTENVVILAQHAGKWYALKAEYVEGKTDRLVALPVDYINGTLYNVPEADKALITWERVVIGNKATFKNGDNYLKGKSSTTLIIESETTGLYQWDYPSYTMVLEGSTTVRTFLYYNTNNCFRNYDSANASDGIDEEKAYSALPVVTAAKFETAEFYIRPGLPVGNYGTICLPYAVNNFTGATFYEVAGKEGSKIVFDEVTELEAGKPYIFMAEAAEIKLAQVGEEYTGSAKLHNSLQGTFDDITDGEAGAAGNILEGNYMVVNNIIKKCGANCGLKANRAYFVATILDNLGAAPQPMPGRRRVTMGVTGENAATGVDNITENGAIAPKKLIENGQLIIIRNGEKFNVQGQKL